MAIKKSSGWEDNSMEHNFGNVSKVHFRHVFTEADKDGDVIRMGRMGFGLTYFSTLLVSKSGLGPGVSVDLGYSGIESCEDVPEYFVAGESGLATKAEISKPTLRVMTGNGPDRCSCEDAPAPGDCDETMAELHDVILTIHGSPAAGACIDVVLEYESTLI